MLFRSREHDFSGAALFVTRVTLSCLSFPHRSQRHRFQARYRATADRPPRVRPLLPPPQTRRRKTRHVASRVEKHQIFNRVSFFSFSFFENFSQNQRRRGDGHRVACDETAVRFFCTESPYTGAPRKTSITRIRTGAECGAGSRDPGKTPPTHRA